MHDLHVDDNLQWLSSLSSLQYLDMSGVNLAKISSDNLFHAVNMLPSLSVLILPNCHLHWPQPSSSIRIPSSDQLQTLDDTSIYIGKLDLCGPPLTIKCDDNTTHGFSDEEDDLDESEMLWLCYGNVVGYVLGVWAVCIALWFNVSWRNSYFRLADCMHKKFLRVTTTKYSSEIDADDESGSMDNLVMNLKLTT
ncbi:receptor-like protein EIX2 [Dioscorea cayenensis subsp. rotundata]|uniref:Receptor-like protein EIX2 n=1 Tax=Dioscorea cayennensis subsp. rotundata TaxID=55577 RepID=A0AB40C5E0_DIOCR|nr:receptor-like protein EIX2 [Dioscorea cayenensis subsp. rotundata]